MRKKNAFINVTASMGRGLLYAYLYIMFRPKICYQSRKAKEEIEKGEVYLLAASSASKEASDEWVKEIQEAFPGMDVVCDELSLGVSCHIGPGGLGIGCSCRPKRI